MKKNNTVVSLINVMNQLSKEEFNSMLQSIKEAMETQFGLKIDIWKEDPCEEFELSINEQVIEAISSIVEFMNSTTTIEEKIEYATQLCDAVNEDQQKTTIDLYGIEKKRISYELIQQMKDLTLKEANAVIGQAIIWDYHGYNQNRFFQITKIGSLINEWEMIKDKSCGENLTHGERLIKMKSPYIERAKLTTCILDHKGRDTYMRELNQGWYNERTFTCSDADREVSFLLINQL